MGPKPSFGFVIPPKGPSQKIKYHCNSYVLHKGGTIAEFNYNGTFFDFGFSNGGHSRIFWFDGIIPILSKNVIVLVFLPL